MENDSRLEKLRSIIWQRAGTKDSGLDFIVGSENQFTIGAIRRDDNGYFVVVEDAYQNQQHKAYLGEEDLRGEDFTADIREANFFYEKSKEEQARTEKIAKQRRNSSI